MSTEPTARSDRVTREWSVPARLVHAAILMAVWLLFSGRYDAFHVGAGVFSVGLVLLLNRRLFQLRLFPGDVHRRLLTRRVLLYAPWLFKEIAIAAVGVARVVLSRRIAIRPSLLAFHSDLPNPTAQAILANSITLTPGTITVEVDHGVFLVHALTDRSSAGLVDGSMPARVARLFVGDESGAVSDVLVTRSNAGPQ